LCNQGFTGEKCSLTYKDILEKDYNPKKYIKHYGLIAGAGMFLMIIFAIIAK